jgi:hypothetical protein
MKNIHLIPTEKPSSLVLETKNNNLFITTTKDFGTKIMKFQNIYITSDEKIKEGGWHFNLALNLVEKTTSFHNGLLCEKIILTTDQDLIKNGVQAIDDEFLEWFVKNPICEFVKIEHNYIDWIIDNYKIIIPQEEPNYNIKLEVEWVLNNPQCKQIESCSKSLSKKCICPKEEPKQEIWKDIPNYESLYQVSNFGNVKSLERYVKGKVENRLQKETILSKRLVGGKGNQYYSVTLCNNKDRKQIKVSVLVAMAFLNHIPNGYIGLTVDHIDNNPLNNNINNLQVITKRENSSKDRKGISKYTGVTFNKKSNKWRSQIWINGKNKTLGSFNDELEAHRAYQKELQQHLKYQL